MQRLLPFTLLLAGCGPSWTAYNSPEGGYCVELPGLPVEEQRGELLLTRSVRVDGPTCSYAVSFLALPDEDLPLPPLKDRLMATYAKEVLSETPVDVAGYAGSEWEMSIKPRGFATVRVFTKGDRRYELVVLGDNARAKEPDVRRFLDSFRILD